MNNEEIDFPVKASPALTKACHVDTTVHQMQRRGATLDAIILRLTEEKQLFIDKFIEIESYAPRRIKLPNGDIALWRCPEQFIPIKEACSSRRDT